MDLQKFNQLKLAFEKELSKYEIAYPNILYSWDIGLKGNQVLFSIKDDIKDERLVNLITSSYNLISSRFD